MMAVISSRRVDGWGGRGVLRSRRVWTGLRSTGGVQTAMSNAVMLVGWAGRPSSRFRYREVAHLTLRALYRGGGRAARWPGRPGRWRWAGRRAVRADAAGCGELLPRGFHRGG